MTTPNTSRSIHYDLSKFKGCTDAEGRQLAGFTIRGTTGADETYAAKQAEARGTGMSEELIRFSLVSYEVVESAEVTKTVDITHPFVAFDHWSTKARNFVVAAWKRLSTPDEDEIKSFFGNASESE